MGNACKRNLFRLQLCFVESVGFYPIYFLKSMKLVLWDRCGVFAQTNVGLVRVCHLVSCFLGFVVLGNLVVFSGV